MRWSPRVWQHPTGHSCSSIAAVRMAASAEWSDTDSYQTCRWGATRDWRWLGWGLFAVGMALAGGDVLGIAVDVA